MQSVFAKDVLISGPSGSYKFLVYFERGAAATGGEVAFQVFNSTDMPPVTREIVLWGQDESLAAWLTQQNIRTRPYLSPCWPRPRVDFGGECPW